MKYYISSYINDVPIASEFLVGDNPVLVAKKHLSFLLKSRTLKLVRVIVTNQFGTMWVYDILIDSAKKELNIVNSFKN